MKAGLYWRYATRSLRRGGQRTVLAIFCVAVGVMAIVSLQLVGDMVNQGLTGNVREGNGGDVSIRSDLTPLRQDQLSVFDQLKSDGTLTQYTAVSGHSAQAAAHDGSTAFFSLSAVNPSEFPLVGSPTFTDPSDGSLSSLLSGTDLVITSNLGNTLGAKVGQALTISSDDGRVVKGTVKGIIAANGFFQRAQVLMSVSGYKAIPSSSGVPANYSVVYVNVPDHSDANADTAKKALEKELPTATITTTKDALQRNQDQVQNIRYFLQVVGLLALLIGGVGIINTMQVLLRRRQTEIAMLKTAGYRRVDLYWLFGTEAALLGLLGGVIGSLAGIGVSLLVKGLVERAFFIKLPVTISPVTVASGIVIGFATALIFGLMPIVQASQIRPLAVLRGLNERLQGVGILLTLFLSVILALLFFGLSWLILGNVFVALGAVVGALIFLGLLSLFFTLIVLLVGRFPVPERLQWWYLLGAVVLLALGVLLTVAVPGFGVLILVIGILAALVMFLPRTAKANARMALRNLDRQKARTVTTMVALFVGVFAIGLVLTLGLNIRNEINNAFSTQVPYNSFIIAGAQDKAAVDAHVSDLSGVKAKAINAIAQDVPVSVRGEPIGQLLQGVPTAGGPDSTGRGGALFALSGVQGYDLAEGQKLEDITLAEGFQKGDAQGRLLQASDANTNNVILPQFASLAPLKLKVGDTVTVISPNAVPQTTGQGQGATTGQSTGPKAEPVTLTVVGFYNGGITSFSPILADTSVATKIAGNSIFYVYSLKLDPQQADQSLHDVQKDVPSVQTFSLVELTIFIDTLLTNLIILLTAVASLAMIAGFIIIANAVGLAMLERRREIGILKSVGFTSSNVLGEVVFENGLIGFIGAGLATLL
ncbi:MAG TPA: FtsX-like permease family protein, partial [Ktedonobacterales bacterium]|nr:FtsX-like permease family protein [Ktedonobacterales bacterium]